MAVHVLSPNFAAFFTNLNPASSFTTTAGREYASIKALIEAPSGPASPLTPTCFLQGSYRQDTAIHTINDVDVVTLCRLWQPQSDAGVGGSSWNRHRIFDTIAAPLLRDGRYRDKVTYSQQSMCIKVNLGIKVEILPVVYKTGNKNPSVEPFRLWRPEVARWEDGYARYHQQLLTAKNQATGGHFKPAVKVLKHIRWLMRIPSVSFHLECLLYALGDSYFAGPPADYIPILLEQVARFSADTWYDTGIRTPCAEREILTDGEWHYASWKLFHSNLVTWSKVARAASDSRQVRQAIEYWQMLLGPNFPAAVT